MNFVFLRCLLLVGIMNVTALFADKIKVFNETNGKMHVAVFYKKGDKAVPAPEAKSTYISPGNTVSIDRPASKLGQDREIYVSTSDPIPLQEMRADNFLHGNIGDSQGAEFYLRKDDGVLKVLTKKEFDKKYLKGKY